MTFERGNLRVDVSEEMEIVSISRQGDDEALTLGVEELAWLLWGPGSAALARLRENQREPAAAADGLAVDDGTEVSDGQMTMEEAHV